MFRLVCLEIVTHPGVAHPGAFEADYGMRQEIVYVETRTAIAPGYAIAAQEEA